MIQQLIDKIFGSRHDREAWYACYTRPRHEKHVERRIAQRGFDCYLPVVPRDAQWKDPGEAGLLPHVPWVPFRPLRVAGRL